MSHRATDTQVKSVFFSSLDGLRGLAILGVVIHHMDLWPDGRYGVRIFFAISGFLVSTLLIREKENKGRVDIPGFYVRRALRIFPLMGLTVIAYVALAIIGIMGDRSRYFWDTLPYYLTFTSTWFVDRAGGDPSPVFFLWALSVEMQFYLMWPWIADRLSLKHASVLVFFLFLVSQLAFFWIQHHQYAFLSAPLPLIILQSMRPEIFGGIFLAYILCRRNGESSPLIFRASSMPAVATAVLCLALSLDNQLPAQIADLLICFCIVWLIGACVAREDHLFLILLNWKPLVFVGSVSYGIYLNHMLVKSMVIRIFSFDASLMADLTITIITLVISIVFAALTYYWVERPVMAYRSIFGYKEKLSCRN